MNCDGEYVPIWNQDQPENVQNSSCASDSSGFESFGNPVDLNNYYINQDALNAQWPVQGTNRIPYFGANPVSSVPQWSPDFQPHLRLFAPYNAHFPNSQYGSGGQWGQKNDFYPPCPYTVSPALQPTGSNVPAASSHRYDSIGFPADCSHVKAPFSGSPFYDGQPWNTVTRNSTLNYHALPPAGDLYEGHSTSVQQEAQHIGPDIPKNDESTSPSIDDRDKSPAISEKSIKNTISPHSPMIDPLQEIQASPRRSGERHSVKPKILLNGISQWARSGGLLCDWSRIDSSGLTFSLTKDLTSNLTKGTSHSDLALLDLDPSNILYHILDICLRFLRDPNMPSSQERYMLIFFASDPPSMTYMPIAGLRQSIDQVRDSFTQDSRAARTQ